MRGGLIIWNTDKLERLFSSIREARERGGDVIFADVTQNRFVKHPTHTWTIREAEAIYRDAKAEIDAAPVRDYPENLEGREP